MKIGDRVTHKKANIIGYIIAINSAVATIERRDLPMTRTCNGARIYPRNVCAIDNLIVEQITHAEVLKQLSLLGL